MTDHPNLYRVQTTAGESVVVVDTASFFMASEDSNMRWFKDDGVRFGWPKGPHLNLRTLTRLSLWTDEELQARDDALLERVAVKLDHLRAMQAHLCAAAVRAMKGQNHER